MGNIETRFFIIPALLFQMFLAAAVCPQTKETNPNVAGDLRFHELQSKVFGNTRTLRVLLPPDYEKHPKKKYPVLYLNDGQNLFDAELAQSDSMEWRVDETYQKLLGEKAIEPLIIVGIDNAGRRERPNEYLPFPDKYLSPPLPQPNGRKYPDFLTGEVMPLIEKLYRVKTGAENTGLGGSSYGALIALHTVIEKPGVFGRLLLESPSFYVDEAQILKDSEKLKKLPEKVYLGVGTNEENKPNCRPGDLEHEAVQDVLKLKKILLDKKIGKNKLKVFIEDCAIHNEEAYGRRFPVALKFLYGKQ
jgi:predicted alpha/beta superfamily hydrolase